MIVSVKKFFGGGGNIAERFLRSLDCYRLRSRFRQVFGFRANPGADLVRLAVDKERIVRELSALGIKWLSLNDAYRKALLDYRGMTVASDTVSHRWSAKCKLRVLRMEIISARRKFFGACSIPKLVGYTIGSEPENYVPWGRRDEVLCEIILFYDRYFSATPKRSF